MRIFLRSVMASVALFVVPLFTFAAADPNISTISSTVDNSALNAVSTHTITFTTADALDPGDTLTFLYTADVHPASIGVDFASADITEEEPGLEGTFSVSEEASFSFVLTLTSELLIGTYTITAANVQNPSEDITAYITATTEAELSEESNTTRDSEGVAFGEGSEESIDDSETPATCEEEPQVEDIQNASAVVFGEYVHLTWDDLDTASSYVVFYSFEENLMDPVTIETGITDNSYVISDFDTATQYYVGIRADDANTCQVGSASVDVTTEDTALAEQRMLKSEFKFPTKKRKPYKFNIKPQLGEELAVVQRLEYQIFKGKTAAKAQRIGKKVRRQKNSELGNAIIVSGKHVEPDTYYWVRMRKVYTIGEETIKTEYSKKKRVKTKTAAVVE